jgi:hypothetical protein
MPCVRNSLASASSVSLFPRERMRDMTSERLDLEKTSAINLLARITPIVADSNSR